MPKDSSTRRKAALLHDALLGWYARARRDLPWRHTRDPYAIWLSEIMLQQTRVETVIPYFARFLDAYPTVHALAEAPLDGVLSRWSGLGYYRRARMLHEAAQQVVRERGGHFPDTAEGLAEIKGIGRYTAGAIASIAFGRSAAVVDGNVTRVLARLFAIDEEVRGGGGLARVWTIAEALVPKEDAGSWNQALMELGATTCVPKNPRCLLCPVVTVCDARAQGKEHRLPLLAPKAKPKRVGRIALVGTHHGRLLLGRRPTDGIFGGLWEPPSLDTDDSAGSGRAARGRFEALVGARITRMKSLGTITHVLSHRRLEVEVFGGALLAEPPREPQDPATRVLYEAFELVDVVAMPRRGVATLARKVLAVAKVG